LLFIVLKRELPYLSPRYPGCWSEGDTEEEAIENIQDTIREYLTALEERLQDAEIHEIEMQV